MEGRPVLRGLGIGCMIAPGLITMLVAMCHVIETGVLCAMAAQFATGVALYLAGKEPSGLSVGCAFGQPPKGGYVAQLKRVAAKRNQWWMTK